MRWGTLNVPNEVGRDRVGSQPQTHLLLEMPTLSPRYWKIDEYPPLLLRAPRAFPPPVNLDSINDWATKWINGEPPRRTVTLIVKDSISEVTAKGGPCMKLRIAEPGIPDMRRDIPLAAVGDRHIWIHGPSLHPLQFTPMHEVINMMVEQEGYCMLRIRLRKASAKSRFYHYIYSHNVTGSSLLNARVSLAVAQTLAERYDIPDPENLLRKEANE